MCGDSQEPASKEAFARFGEAVSNFLQLSRLRKESFRFFCQQHRTGAAIAPLKMNKGVESTPLLYEIYCCFYAPG
jgi:hypothetical protein